MRTDLANALTSMVFSALFIGTLVRFGVVAVASAWFVFFLLSQSPLTADLTRIYAPTAGWLMFIVAALAGYAFYASRAGGPLFGRLMPQD